MKWFTILLTFLLCFLSSCGKKPPEVNYTWTGQEGIRHFVPTCIVWYKQVPPPLDVWKPYKSFSQTDAEQMREVILQLTRPEKKEPNPHLRTKDKLSLIFYNGFPEKLKVWEVYFEIKDQTFIGPLGESDILAKILLERQEVRSLFYYPYSDLGAGHYNDDFERILQINESQQKLAEKLKPEREAGTQKKIEEANQSN